MVLFDVAVMVLGQGMVIVPVRQHSCRHVCAELAGATLSD